MAARPNTVKTVKKLRKRVAAWRAGGKTVALVPTMGALHEGHLSLVRLARGKGTRVVVSIFVNPTQFAPHEDLDAYPRDFKSDCGKLAAEGVDIIFAPTADEMYPEGFATSVSVSGLTEVLCGASRPDHFGGVATVVAKLLVQCLPDIAIFGEKDYQQLQVIKRFTRDLDIPVKILGGPIVREADGLALSSRNAYLSPAERAAAPLLNLTIVKIAKALSEGAVIEDEVARGRKALENADFRLDYLDVRNAGTLALVSGKADEPARVFVAAFLGKTRLIDNVAVRPNPL